MSFDLFTNFATDETLENKGAWRDIGPGARLLVARNGNRHYARALTLAIDEARPILDMKGEIADAKSDEILISVLADTILLGWEGVSYKGQDLPYTKENARTLLKMRDFRLLVQRLADEQQAYRMKLEEEQGNS
ncbi:MAG: hypothetical protein RLZZ524_1909 [Pseudomonadota bacterium]|jgi:hypothetical protein